MSVPGKNSMPWMTTEFGYVWMGMDPVTQEDFEAFHAAMQDTIAAGIPLEDFEFDRFAYPGRLDPWYTAKIWITGRTSTAKMGGLGSHTYECQKVGNGVAFKPEDQKAIWHVDPEGVRVHGVVDYPRLGRSFHTDEWQQTVAGPEPGSEAEQFLGDGEYAWDTVNQWWIIK